MDEVVQGSAAWHALRIGKATASRVSDITAKTKSGPSAMRANYMAELLAERLTGQVAEGYTSAAMQHGTDTEQEAKDAYSFLRNLDLADVGFVDHPKIEMAGASPDALVGTSGLVEFKCPNTKTHIEYLMDGPVEKKYREQMAFQMACTGRAWCDFVSYDPRLPGPYRLHVRRFQRDESQIGELEKSVIAFLEELDAMEAALRTSFEPKEVLNILAAG